MSSTNTSHLTEEQDKFLNSLEEEFKDRYTENDEDFKAILNESLPLPPVVDNWVDNWQRDDRNDRYRYMRSHNHNRFERDRYREYRSREPYYRDSSDRYSHSSREPYSHDSYDRYSHSGREPYSHDNYDGYSHSSRDSYRYNQQNHY